MVEVEMVEVVEMVVHKVDGKSQSQIKSEQISSDNLNTICRVLRKSASVQKNRLKNPSVYRIGVLCFATLIHTNSPEWRQI